MEGLEPLDEQEVVLLRCSTCRKGLDTNLSSGAKCSFCHGAKWTNQIGRLSARERVAVYRLSGSWVRNNPPDVLDRAVVKLEPLITALGG